MTFDDEIDPRLLAEEVAFWDALEEADDGIPRSYRHNTQKVQIREFEEE